MPAPNLSRTRSSHHFDDQPARDLVLALAGCPASDPRHARLRRQAIEAWLPMAGRIARRYAERGEPLDDLVQVATVGLIKAIDGFDPERGADFVGYALPTMLGELKRYFRDRSWAVRVPRRVQEMRLNIFRAETELNQRLGRPPTVTDIAAHLETTEEAVLEGLEGGNAHRAVFLSTPIGTDPGLTLADTLSTDEDGYASAEFTASLPAAMSHLTEREKRIVVLYFYGNVTQVRIAEQLGISQMHVSRLLAGALRTLRHQLTDG